MRAGELKLSSSVHSPLLRKYKRHRRQTHQEEAKSPERKEKKTGVERWAPTSALLVVASKESPQYDRLFKPMPLSFKKAPVSHPELKATCCLTPGVEKQTSHCHYVQLRMITKGVAIAGLVS